MHLVTAHNQLGRAVFHPDLPPEAPQLPYPDNTGFLQLLWSSSTLASDVSGTEDVSAYAQMRTAGPVERNIFPSAGVAVLAGNLAPGQASQWHRTMTVDTVFITHGVVELQLDGEGGEVRRLRAGDSVVQRGTMHSWKNVTEEGDGWVRMLAFVQPCKAPIEAGEKRLETAWKCGRDEREGGC